MHLFASEHHKFPKKKASAGVSRTKVGTTFLRRKSHKRDPNDIFRPAIIPPDEDGERPVPIFFPKTTRNHPTRSPNKIETTKTHYQRTASNRATTSSIPTTRKIKKMIGCREGRHKGEYKFRIMNKVVVERRFENGFIFIIIHS